MAGDILGIGTSGLLTSQRNLATTSHNISNVNTDGYSRQRTEQEARMPQYSGNGYVGTGVTVQTTIRLANEFLEKQVRNSNSQLGQYDAYNRLASQVDNIIANPDTGLTPALENFYSALQDANDNPSSTASRQVLLTEANTLTDRFELLDTRFNEINDQTSQALIDLTAEVSDAARSIARLNADITLRIGVGQGDMPNDLIDQREVLIKSISENIDVSVVYQDDGSANLFIGTGQPLVIGSHSLTLATQTSKFNVSDLDIVLIEGGSSTIVTNMIKGGELQGVLDFKAEILDPARRSLGRIAIAITEEMNAQHKLGMTLQDTGAGFKPGDNFFNDLSGPMLALGAVNNTGVVEFEIIDSRILSTSDYQLNRTGIAGSEYTLIKLDDMTTYTASSIANLNAAMSTVEGFSLIDPPATVPVIGDSFLIRPTLEAAAEISVAVNNVLDIALAAPIVAGAMTNPDGSGGAVNAGTGEIGLPSGIKSYPLPSGDVRMPIDTTALDGELTDFPSSLSPPMQLAFDGTNQFTISWPSLPAGATLEYFDASGYNSPVPLVSIPYTPANDSGGITYTIRSPLSGDSFSFSIQGVPELSDSFEIGSNETPFNDNRNGLLMSKLQTTKTLENGSTDFQAGYSMIVSDVGAKTRSSSIDLLAQQTLNEQAKAVRESYSGVNLDEEAADLLKFQQAYQASARVISSADEMFQTLISAV